MAKFEQTCDQILSQNSIFGVFEPLLDGSYGPLTENYGKIPKTYRYISLESPKNLTWPNLNKPATGDFDHTMSQKSYISAINNLENSQKSLFKPK